MRAAIDGPSASPAARSVCDRFFRDFVAHAPIYDVHEIACPVLFLQGTEDNPFRRSDAWLGYQLRLGAGVPVTHVEIEGGDHGLGSRATESTAVAVSWLRAEHISQSP
jgi:pimeloyl-ACP methyl ester carboxylesterase